MDFYYELNGMFSCGMIFGTCLIKFYGTMKEIMVKFISVYNIDMRTPK